MPKRLLLVGLTLVALAALAFALMRRPAAGSQSAEFTRLMSRGNGLYDKGDAPGAIDAYRQALQLSPSSLDVHLNLANASLLAGKSADAIPLCRKALELDRNSGAAYYLLGCALLRENQPEPAAEAFQQSWKIARNIPALDFQMGIAQMQLGQTADAIRDFESVLRVDPNHPSAHFQLSQLYRRAGRAADANRELQLHQQILAKAPNSPATAAALERCQYTQALAPFVLEQPDPRGIAVRFVDETAQTLGDAAKDYRGPLALLDCDHDGRLNLFTRDQAGNFLLLDNRQGKFTPLGRPVHASPEGGYRTALVGDLDNDGIDDVVVLGEHDSRVLKFSAHGRMRDATRAAGLESVKATAGLLADLNFTGNLDLVVVQPGGSGLGLHRNLGNFFFDPSWSDSGLDKSIAQATQVLSEDWNNDGLPGVFVARANAAPAYFAKERASAYSPRPLASTWPPGSVIEIGDLNNDLRAEAVVATGSSLEIVGHEAGSSVHLPLADFPVTGLALVDYDNDGWLDIVAYGSKGLRIWRNRGLAGFVDVTRTLGLDQTGPVDGFVAADFDGDGDPDFITSSATGLRFWRNQGGNQNHQLKLRLAGNRSNSSALGVRVEAIAGSWRTRRTVHRIPFEIGVGAHTQLDALKVHWFDLSTAQVDVPVTPEVFTVTEPTLPSGSCPYLYAWDGHDFRFVTDVLGAAPLGLPINEKVLVPADSEELLVLGDEQRFPAHNGAYEIRLTDELREVLYLDEAHLIAVDHPADTLVYPTSKMMPRPPFPAHELWTLRPAAPLQHATRNDGLDVTAALSQIDRQMVSPVQLRRAQLRGLAEPYSVTLDFGPLTADRPWVLALTGWIHFGGGMANISGSIDPTLPFPFPQLEAESPDGGWQKVDVVVGTPAGKTKTILVDLENKLPPGTRRLRLSAAYEIYWDCAQMLEKSAASQNHEYSLPPAHTDLHERGYARYADLPVSQPLTPVYGDVSPTPPWDTTPGGWFTRYGPVDDLVNQRDDRLVLLAGGDELSLSFDAAHLPPPTTGMKRDFFLHLVGWDKDSDFHVAQGWRLEPFPFRGMDDQAYGRQTRPTHLDDSWIKTYNTRWVDPVIVSPGEKPRATQILTRDAPAEQRDAGAPASEAGAN